MLKVNAEMFLQLPSESDKRILHPGAITGDEEGVWIAELEEPDLEVAVDQEVLVYYEIKRKFSKQPARIQMVSGDETTIVSFQTTGDAVQAEDRECYRAATKAYRLTATVDGRPNCRLDDISEKGFGVISPSEYQIGQTLKVRIGFKGERSTGTAVVQAVREMSRGRRRYGMSWVGDKNDGGDLQKGAHTINIAIQHEQMRRRAGDAAA